MYVLMVTLNLLWQAGHEVDESMKQHIATFAPNTFKMDEEESLPVTLSPLGYNVIYLFYMLNFKVDTVITKKRTALSH